MNLHRLLFYDHAKHRFCCNLSSLIENRRDLRNQSDNSSERERHLAKFAQIELFRIEVKVF